jgi:hypothetical protein
VKAGAEESLRDELRDALRKLREPIYHPHMERARRHQRLLSALAFGLLAVLAELVGASLTHRIDLGRHVRSPSYSHAAYYPALVAAVKVGIALLLVSLLCRMLRAHAIERAARRVAGAVGGETPRVRVRLSVRLWLAFFTITATTYLVHDDASRIASGRWALFFPWVHSSALPVFAVLAVVFALAWGAVQRWLADYEQWAEDAARLAQTLGRLRSPALGFPRTADAVPPRRLFGFVLNSRPPPAAA